MCDITLKEIFNKCVTEKNGHVEVEMKFYCYLISKIQTKMHELIRAEEEGRETMRLDDIEYNICDEKNRYCVYVNNKELIKSSTKSKFTNDELQELLNNICKIDIKLEDEKSYKIIKPIIKAEIEKDCGDTYYTFNPEAIDYLIELKKNWSQVYPHELRELKGRFMIGLYCCFVKFRRTGEMILKIEDAKRFFGCENYTNVEFIRTLKKYAIRFNEQLNKDLKVTGDNEKGGKKTNCITITFKAEKGE